MRRQFVVGDYTYTRPDMTEGSRTSYTSWAKNATKTSSWSVPTGYDYVTDATSLYGIKLILFNTERTFYEEYKFIYGESEVKDSSENFTVTYGGASSITIKAKKALSYVVLDRSVTFYDKSQVNAKATSLSEVSYANIPSTVTDDDGVTATVTDCDFTFSGCRNLVTAPTIPNTVETMQYCFNNCVSLSSAPEIPSSVVFMERCFSKCVALEGNVVVNNPLSGYYISRNMFINTVNDIFIVNNGSGETSWRGIASEYANVHYEADDNPAPAVSNLTVTRVGSSGSTTYDQNGLYAYIQVRVMAYDDLIPALWTNEIKSISMTIDGSARLPTWAPAITDYPADIHCWQPLYDTAAHLVTLQVQDSVKDNGTEVRSQSSATLSKTVPKVYALVDYYHDDVADTEGVAFGKYAEQANLFDVDMPTRFRQGLFTDTNITADGYIVAGGDIVSEGNVEAEGNLRADIDVVVGEHALFNLDAPIEGTPIQIGSSNIDLSEPSPSDNVYSGSISIYDGSGTRIGSIQSVYFPNGNIGNQLGASREVNGSMVHNNIRAEVAPDGTYAYFVTDKPEFRKAIGLNITTETKQSLNNTISAGGTKSISFDLTSSGKTPIAIKGYNVNNSSSGGQGVSLQNVYGCYISGNTGTVEIRNTWTSQAKVDVYLYVVYMGS